MGYSNCCVMLRKQAAAKVHLCTMYTMYTLYTMYTMCNEDNEILYSCTSGLYEERMELGCTGIFQPELGCRSVRTELTSILNVGNEH